MDDDAKGSLLRVIPSIDRILADPLLNTLRETYSEPLVKRLVRAAVDELREEIRQGKATKEACRTPAVIFRAGAIGMRRLGPKLKPVINATGVIVHTNLGRSPLSMRVIDRIAEMAMSYSNLEYNLENGQRGERNSHLRQLMEELTGAEATLAVNNNAAAVLLALSSLAAGREVLVSRGELVEIGGSFRIPDVMERSGATLKEVGTTNRTHLRDYVKAINDNTALILKVHTSNYRIVGFTSEVSLDELAALGKEKGIPTMMDLGSGCLADLAPYGLADETTVQEVVAKGIDVVSFSGDKLLGGPQAGILAGRADLIEKMRTNPLARALRMDKLTLAGLEATLEEYVRPEGPAGGIPTLDMIMRAPEELEERAGNLAAAIKEQVGALAEIDIEPGVGRVGGGALPTSDLPGPRVAIRPRKISAARLEQGLRSGAPPVIAIVKDEALLLDPRTMLKDQAALIPNLVGAVLGKE
jgi:L-seryl-tRNA(Ser) seleniumtransferase